MKVAIIGCGSVVSQHVRQLKKNPEVQICGVCDSFLEKAKHLAGKIGTEKIFTDVDALLQECNPDVVHILTPPQSHRELTTKCLLAGCHVLVEKPMAMNSIECREMIAASEEKKVKLGVCHNFLFIPAVLEAKKMFRAGMLGEIVHAEVFWRVSRQGKNDRYHNAKWIYELEGGIAHEIAPHPIYLLQYFLGELKVHHSLAKSRTIDLPETVSDLHIQLESNSAVASLTISTNSEPSEKYLRLVGTKCTVQIDLGSSTLIKMEPVGKDNISKVIMNFDRAYQYIFQTIKNGVLTALGRLPHGHDKLIELFYLSLQGGNPIPVTGEDGYEVIQILDEIWKLNREKV